MRTKERLEKALMDIGAPLIMVTKARAGAYDDYESASATPQLDLIQDCTTFNLQNMKIRVMNGEFDGSREESEAWYEREGKDLFRIKPA